MKNHVHLAIRVGEILLFKIIRNLSFRYTRYINKEKSQIEHLFQGRYKAILIDADYNWSGHHSYIGKKREPWITVDWA